MAAKMPEYVSVSSIQDYQSCRLRWCYKWVENRVPRTVPVALEVGKILHKAFEAAFTRGTNVGVELEGLLTPESDQWLRDAIEPLKLWKDQFPVTEVLEVEQPFEFMTEAGIPFRGRPDRVAVVFGKAFHIQNKSVGAAVDPGLYIRLAQRNMHELLYGRYLSQKYAKFTYGGSIYNIVRKLQYRTKAKGKDNAIINGPEKMFLQTIIGLDEVQAQQARADLAELSVEMDRCADRYLNGFPPPSTRKMDGGMFGSHMDPYTAVMLGEADLQDDALFGPREETY
jgi:hypothetical protein